MAAIRASSCEIDGLEDARRHANCCSRSKYPIGSCHFRVRALAILHAWIIYVTEDGGASEGVRAAVLDQGLTEELLKFAAQGFQG